MNSKSNAKHCSPKTLSSKAEIQGVKSSEVYKFKSEHEVPVFEVKSMHELNQIIGKAKFDNRDYGTVYYRGQCELYDNLIPSLYRELYLDIYVRHKKDAHKECAAIGNLESSFFRFVNTIDKDTKLPKDLTKTSDNIHRKEIIKGTLQHYGLKTPYLDLVDNHWVALWMGLNEFKLYEQKPNKYIYSRYEQRVLPRYFTECKYSASFPSCYQYILLVALPSPTGITEDGVYDIAPYTLIDLRRALSSVYLRPHSQHGYVFTKKHVNNALLKDLDASETVVGIIKIRIDRVASWLGNGDLLTQENFFPPAAYDQGYRTLLSRDDLFDKNHKIPRYF